MCSARVGITLEEFNNLTPAELSELMYEHSEVKTSEFRRDVSYQRLFTVFLINTQLKKEHQITNPKRLYTFEWEEELTDEQVEELLKDNWDELDAKYGGKPMLN